MCLLCNINIIKCLHFLDLTYFFRLGQKSRNNFILFLIQMRTKFAFEINWPLASIKDNWEKINKHLIWALNACKSYCSSDIYFLVNLTMRQIWTRITYCASQSYIGRLKWSYEKVWSWVRESLLSNYLGGEEEKHISI